MDTINDNRQSPEFAGQVNRMFDRIAGRYDALNSVMTAGLHHRWRERAAARAELGPGDSRARRLLRHRRPGARAAPAGSAPAATSSAATSPSRCSTSPARRPPSAAPTGSASSGPTRSQLPYDGERFDAVTVGFGVRNLADLDRGLREMARVLKPGGRAGDPRDHRSRRRPPLSIFYSLWFDRIVPLLGAFSGDPEAYSYLPESVRSFPSPRGLAEKMDARRLRSGSATRCSPAGSSRSTAASAA